MIDYHYILVNIEFGLVALKRMRSNAVCYRCGAPRIKKKADPFGRPLRLEPSFLQYFIADDFSGG